MATAQVPGPSSSQPVSGLAAPNPTAKPKRRPVVIGLLVVVVGGVLGGRAFLTRGLETTDDAQVDADIVTIRPEVGGRIAKVDVADNQRVKKGDVLVELDAQELTAKLDQMRAELQTARAEERAAAAQERIVAASAEGGLHTAKAAVSGSALGVSSADSQIDAARAAVQRAESDAKRESLELSRTQALFAQDSIPRQSLDNSSLANDSAQASLAQARATLAAAEDAKRLAQSRVAEAQGRLAQSSPVDARIEAARAASELAKAHVKAAESRVSLAEIDVSKTKVLAPSDGTVSRLTALEGELVAQNQPVAELVPAQAYVVANFKETQLPGIEPGKRAEIRLDAYPGQVLSGVVQSLSGGTGARFSLLPPDNASGNFVKVVQRVPVHIALSQVPPGIPLRAGLSAEATVVTR